MKHRVKHWVEYGLLRFWGWMFTHLPYRAALAVGWGAAWIGHYLLRYRVRIVHARIRQVFPDAQARRVRRIAWLSWRNLFFNLVDIFRLGRIDAAWMQRHLVDFADVREAVEAIRIKQQGGVGVSLHMGSVEVMAVALQRLGLSVFVIDGRQKNLLADAHIRKMRAATGITFLPKDSSLLRQVFRELRDGKFLLLLADLRMRTGGVLVDFLGHRVSVAPGLGLFSKRSQVPVYLSILLREGWTRHRLVMYDPIEPREDLKRDADIQRMTQAVFDVFTQAVYEVPEQWFWYNKHWILEPVETEQPRGEETT